MLGNRRDQPLRSNLDLDAPMVLGNVDRLDTHLTIDNVRYAPCAYLVADDINPVSGEWASRHDPNKVLIVAGTGANPSYNQSTAIENTAVKYAIAKYHKASDTTWGQLSDKDYALEFVYTPVSDGSLALASTSSLGAKSNGFLCYSSSNRLIFRHGAAAGDIDINSMYVVDNNSIAHGMIFGDRSEKCYIYINGIFCASSDISIRNNNLMQNSLQIGAWDGAIPYGGNLLLAAIWDLTTNPFPGALKNRDYFDRIARERFAIIAGIQDIRQGSHTFTRATSAYLDKRLPSTNSRCIYRVSAGWPRVCERPDISGNHVVGYLAEPQATNLCVQSENLTTTWTRENLTTIKTTGFARKIDLEKEPHGLVGDATSNVHGIYQTLTLPATKHCFSVWAAPSSSGGAGGWIKIGTNTADTYAYFNLSTGAVGTVGAAIISYGSEFWQGMWRVWVCFTGSGGAANMQIRAATGDAGETFTGDATKENIWLWGVQIEAVTEDFPSSYIPTVAAAVVRNKDELSYDVRLPIVGNINDLSQAINIGGTDYQPCAYLVADDCQANGTWASRHDPSKALAFAGAGTNPTPQWNAVSRASKSVRYWASNYHQAADNSWGNLSDKDFAFEAIVKVSATNDRIVVTTKADAVGTNPGFSASTSGAGYLYFSVHDGTNGAATNSAILMPDRYIHLFVAGDRSEKMYAFCNGVFANSADISAVVNTLNSGQKLTIGAFCNGSGQYDKDVLLLGLWDLTTNPWPGAATNQEVMGAIARARFNQLFCYQSCRLDCKILHPNANRQNAANILDAGVWSNDRMTVGLTTSDVLSSVGAANGSAQWSMAGSTDIASGVFHKLSVQVRANNAHANVDNAIEATDTSCEMPAGLARVFVGEQLDGTIQPSCLVGAIKLFRSDK